MSAAAKPLRGSERRHSDGYVEDGVRRFYDPRYQATAIKILPGEHYITADPGEMLVTVLGSCVAACVRDPLTGVGGMNHFMLPESDTGHWGGVTAAMRYGNHAMETLINDILATGCPRERLEVKVFGGANVIKGCSSVGLRNTTFVEQYMQNENLPIEATDLGGTHGRRIHYFPTTGLVKRLLLRRSTDHLLFRDEQKFRFKLADTPLEGGVELFE